MNKIESVFAFTFITVSLCFAALTAHEITKDCKESTIIVKGENQ